MATVERCDLTELLVDQCDQCSHCTGRDGGEAADRERTARLIRAGAISAQYPGRCARCGEPFEAGTPIRRRSRHSFDGYVAACCLEDS